MLMRDPEGRVFDTEDEGFWKLCLKYERIHPLYGEPSPDCEECGGTGVGWEEPCNRAGGQWWEWEIGARPFPGGRVEVPVEGLMGFWRRCRLIESLVTPDGGWHRKPRTWRIGHEPSRRLYRRELELENLWRREFARLLRDNERCTAVCVGAELARWTDRRTD